MYRIRVNLGPIFIDLFCYIMKRTLPGEARWDSPKLLIAVSFNLFYKC
jgi:hypothetical protein